MKVVNQTKKFFIRYFKWKKRYWWNKRDPNLARAILKAYARAVSTTLSNQTIYNDVRANYADISDKTINDYLSILKRLYVIEEIEAWNPNIRSKTSIRTSPKKSMIDPSLAVSALGCSPKDIMMDIRTFGLLFENLVNRDLSIYLNSIGGVLKHYRDRYDLECDNVIHFNNGKYALVETKLGGTKIKEAEVHLNTLKNLILEGEPKLGPPEFMMIITGTNMAYTTDSGILVVPIGASRINIYYNLKELAKVKYPSRVLYITVITRNIIRIRKCSCTSSYIDRRFKIEGRSSAVAERGIVVDVAIVIHVQRIRRIIATWCYCPLKSFI